MSPAGIYVWSALTAALLIALALLGLPWLVLAVGLLIIALGLALALGNYRRLDYWPGEAPPRRRVVAAALASGVLPCAAAVLVLVEQSDSPHSQWLIRGARLWPYRACAGTLALMTCVWPLSTLIDFWHVVPRVRGLGKHYRLPCRSRSTEDQRAWRGLTQLWLAHRVGCYATVRICLLGVLAIALAAFGSKLATAPATLLSGILAVIAAFYVNQLIPMITLATNPPVSLGDQVTIAEEFGTGVNERPVYYVIDVSVEGVSLMLLPGGIADWADLQVLASLTATAIGFST